MFDNPFLGSLHEAVGKAAEMETFADKYGKATGDTARAKSASRLDQNLRQAAAASPMANLMGAAASMATAGLLPKDISGDILGKDESKRRAAFASLGVEGGIGEFMTKLAGKGVNMETSTKFIGDQKSNRENIKKFNLQDAVRNVQINETNDALRAHASNELINAYRESGAGPVESINKAQKASAAVVNELTNIAKTDPTLLNDKSRAADLEKRIGDVAKLPAGGGKEFIAAMQERIKTDSSLKQFGDLGGLMGMGVQGAKIGDEMQQKETQRLDRISALQNKLKDKDLPEAQKAAAAEQIKELEKLGDIRRGPAATRGAGGDVDGAGSGERMTINGTLRIDAGGMGELEAQSGGAAPGGN